MVTGQIRIENELSPFIDLASRGKDRNVPKLQVECTSWTHMFCAARFGRLSFSISMNFIAYFQYLLFLCWQVKDIHSKRSQGHFDLPIDGSQVVNLNRKLRGLCQRTCGESTLWISLVKLLVNFGYAAERRPSNCWAGKWRQSEFAIKPVSDAGWLGAENALVNVHLPSILNWTCEVLLGVHFQKPRLDREDSISRLPLRKLVAQHG